jgi:radical SAM superfamily enzyme with C-terminal helix-hairpin-helix motif
METMPRHVTILDGYVDEPACFGVPPYISPHARNLAGAVAELGGTTSYLTIDEWRKRSPKREALDRQGYLVVIAGALVPGKYLRGTPISLREAKTIVDAFPGRAILGGSSATYGFGVGGGRPPQGRNELRAIFQHLAFLDVDAFVFDLLADGKIAQRRKSMDEWGRWPVAGAPIVEQHPDFPQPLLAEIETYHGCVRYVNSGCAFCMEPAEGKPQFRPVEQVLAEFEALGKIGVRNFRIGGQADFFSFHAKGVGTTPTPRPNVDAIETLLTGIHARVPDLGVLHIDNVDPAILVAHPKESERVARLVSALCTDGNIAAFGLETADPNVHDKNNLNVTADECLEAIRLLNRVGADRGPSGMPRFLPGLNFICGLPGESLSTYDHNRKFLERVRDEGLLVRRINIRKLLEQRIAGGADESAFHKFKDWTRRNVDHPLLVKMLPVGTVIRNVYLEARDGHLTYGRQVGSYPILIGLPYDAPLERFVDVAITDHGMRSVTGVEFPLDVNRASLRAIEALPGVGAKRAMRIIRARPFLSVAALRAAFDDAKVAAAVAPFVVVR